MIEPALDMYLIMFILVCKTAHGVTSHRENVLQDKEEDQDIEEKLPAFVSLDQLYNSVRLIYQADFANKDYKQANDYGNAAAHSFKVSLCQLPSLASCFFIS